MPKHFLNLQLFGDEGAGDLAGTGEVASPIAEGSEVDGGATNTEDQQVATADGESWDSLIKGKYKKDYNASVKKAVEKRFRNQQNLQAQIDGYRPIMEALASKYNINANPDGSIPIEELNKHILDDDSVYEREAFDRGMSVEDLKQIKSLERENAQLRAMRQQSEEEREWNSILEQAEKAKQVYPDLDLDVEMVNPHFGRLLATMQKSGFPNAVQTAYEAIHRDEIMGGAMRYAVAQTQQKISNSIQSGMRRPQENGTNPGAAANVAGVDPSKLTKADIEAIKVRASRGERITF